MPTPQEIERLVEQHLAEMLRVASSVSQRSGLNDADVRSAAQYALFKAAEKYDPAKGDFVPYASTAVRNAIRTLLSEQDAERQRFLPLDFTNRGDSEPGGSMEYADPSADTFLAAANRDRQKLIASVLKLCPEREARAATLFADGKSLAQIGEELGVSKTMAHKILQSALDRMRGELEAKVLHPVLAAQADEPQDSSPKHPQMVGLCAQTPTRLDDWNSFHLSPPPPPPPPPWYIRLWRFWRMLTEKDS